MAAKKPERAEGKEATRSRRRTGEGTEAADSQTPAGGKSSAAAKSGTAGSGGTRARRSGSRATGEGEAMTAGREKSGTSAAASKSAGARSRKAPAAGGTSGRSAGRARRGSALQTELRSFVDQHPGGWGHSEWTGLLGRLREQGHDTSDEGALGMELEKQRLARRLEDVPGLGPTRVKRLVERFETLWSLRHASVDDIAATEGLNRSLAERVNEALR